MIDYESLIQAQLESWPLVKERYGQLDHVQTRSLGWAGVQFNPARIVSTGAKVDAKSLAERLCFLCAGKRPAEQNSLVWKPKEEGGTAVYEVLVNPFPIFKRHLTIVSLEHTPQRIYGRVGHMCEMAKELEGMVVFYNGARCGASAPDHMHFQAAKADLPVMKGSTPFGIITIEAEDSEKIMAEFARVASLLPSKNGEEPMMNVLCQYSDNKIRLVIIPRKALRPHFFGYDEGQMLISPASVDLGGIVITPREKDYLDLDSTILQSIYSDVCYTQKEVDEMISNQTERKVSVGILSAKEICMHLDGTYLLSDGDSVKETEGLLKIDAKYVKSPIALRPLSALCKARIEDVIIGLDFHWERKEAQTFGGELLILPGIKDLTVVNIINLEQYLASVISSEMSANSHPELLKAHAIISRSWVLAQITNKIKRLSDSAAAHEIIDDERIIRWYDHDAHKLFDVCADDHCQRYQGLARQTSPEAEAAVEATKGIVLTYEGDICDARFSKCCGGAFELFENCWGEGEGKSYFAEGADFIPAYAIPDLSIEEKAKEWIMSSPKAFCNTTDKQVLRQVLNDYDQATSNFYRWKVAYTAQELQEIIKIKSGFDFGAIKEIVPLRRGTSGRIALLKIVGEKLTKEVGKELEIRRWLSPTHLYSSAFVVEKQGDGRFIFHGAGWGHGVGLCQIGAAMMAYKGYSFKEILAHYYPATELSQY